MKMVFLNVITIKRRTIPYVSVPEVHTQLDGMYLVHFVQIHVNIDYPRAPGGGHRNAARPSVCVCVRRSGLVARKLLVQSQLYSYQM